MKISKQEVPAGNMERGHVLPHSPGSPYRPRTQYCTHLLKFLDLGLFEHGEHVGIGAFRSLLGFLGCLGDNRDSDGGSEAGNEKTRAGPMSA